MLITAKSNNVNEKLVVAQRLTVGHNWGSFKYFIHFETMMFIYISLDIYFHCMPIY